VIDGILNINKPTGWTSHDVVQKIRRVLGQSRVGHTGTLDPLATGVLLLCLGKATRISQYLSNLDKTYVATIRLGETTDTGDAEGRVVERRVVQVTKKDLQNILPRFRGKVQQIPPMFSAVKQGGKRLYQLARAGSIVERAPRLISVYGIDLLHFEERDLILRIQCSKGTYIRSLAADLGRELGCGGHVTGLQRERVGQFGLEDAYTLSEVEQRHRNNLLSRDVLSINDALGHLPKIRIEKENQLRIEHGTPVSLSSSGFSLDMEYNQVPVRLMGDHDRLLGLGTVELNRVQSALSVRPICVFV
jgi:tRNA pseudouridine55 synthase